jgi:PDZ domain-containing protein
VEERVMAANRPPRRGRQLLVLLLVLAFVISERLLASTYWVMMPGVAIPLDRVVDVEGKAFRSEGDFFLVAVSTSRASLSGLIRSWFDRSVDIIPASSQIPPGMDLSEYKQIMDRLMHESQIVAVAVALTHAGYDVTFRSEARIEAFLPDSPAASELRVGDVIVAVDGEPIETAEQAVRKIQDRAIGDTVTVSVDREGRLIHAEIRTSSITDSEGTKKPGIRVLIGPRLEYDLPFEVTIDSGDIGGSSAGLMFALEVRDRLDEFDLTGGKLVCGTGTIDIEGNVGPVGGVRQKVATALAQGAEVFLCPQDNYDEALSAADGIEIVPVDRFQTAYDFLIRAAGRSQPEQ